MKAILTLIFIGILVLLSLYLITKKEIYEPFELTSLNDVKTSLQTTNLSGKTFAKVYKNIAVNQPNLSSFWTTLQDPSQSILMDDRLEILRMISCLSFNHEQFANFPKFFRTTDYYTQYFETVSNNFKNVKANLITQKVKDFQRNIGKKIHGPLILLMFQAPRYTMDKGTMSIMNFNIGDYNFKSSNKNEPIHMSFYLIAPLHNKDGTPNLNRTKADICCRLQWLKTKANTDNLCFVETPNDTIQSFGGCRNIKDTSNWQCADKRIIRRNGNRFECLTAKNSNTCLVAQTETQCNNAIISNVTTIPINNKEEVAYLNQIIPNVKYNTKCTGPGKGVSTDKKLMDYGIAYYINPDYPDFANLFDGLAIYPFDETKLGQACPTAATIKQNEIKTFIESGQRIINTEIAIAAIPNPTFPKVYFNNPVIYTIAMWLKPVDYNSNWRNIFTRGRDDQDRTPALYFWPNSTKLHFRHCSTVNLNDGIDSSKVALPLNKYSHIAVVVNKNVMQLYINGILDTTYTSKGIFNWGKRNNKIAFNTYNNMNRGNLIKKFLWFNIPTTLSDINNIMNFA